MKSALTRTFLLLSLFCCTAKFYAQLAPSPTLASSNVSEASQYGVLYQLNIPVTANYSSLASVLYSIDNSSLTLNYTRIAYFLQLDNKWVWVSMNKFNTTNAQLGVPYANSGIIYQQVVTGMNVYSSVGAGVTNTTGISGNIEIWPDCYSTGAALGGVGGSASVYDLNDTRSAGTNCYGSFQVHNYGASQTIFAMNNFMNGTLDLGIGNNSGNTNPDWTFMSNAAAYTTTRKLWVLVQNGITFNNQPSSLAQTACLNGTVAALTVSTTVNSGTLTNYQWYSAATATTTGGTLVATHTTSLTTDSYTPSTTTAGTLYYYCVANGTGSLTTTSSVSGAYTVGNPTVSISGTGSICVGGSRTLTANSSSSPSTFTWSSGASTSSILVSPTVTTTYSVSGTTSLGCVGMSSLVTVTVTPLPVISVANGTICNGGSFILSPTGASTYTFSGGSATVSPVTTTNYTVSGTSLAGCIGTNNVVSVVVNTLPVVSITGTNALCTGASVSLTANGASTYTWSTGSNATGISVSPTVTTTYSVSGTSSAGCIGSSAALTSITVHALPMIAITGANTVCAGSSVGLTASGASTYTWNTTANTASITVAPSANTGYSVSGTSVNGCLSSSSAVTTVSVSSLPVISITGTNAICTGASTSLTANGASTYTWSTGSNATGISVSPTVTTTYSLNGTSSAGCINAAPAVLSVTVNALPVISITGTNAICTGASASLTANGASTYTWNTGSNATGISVSPTVTTTYSVSGTSSAGCIGSSPALTSITVHALPMIAITGANTVCAGSSVGLTASGASTYTWNTTANTASITVTPSATTGYSVSGTSSNGCLSGSSAVTTVSVSSLPLISMTGTNTICTGASTSLTASGASTYTWSTGSNATGISVSPTVTTTYSLNGTSSAGCINAAPAILSVTVNALPVISITGTNAICTGASASLTANGASTYTWNTGSNASGISVSPTVTTTYSVSGTSSVGCVSSGMVVKTLTVHALPTIAITGANTVCAGSSLTLTAAGASTYTWNTGANTAIINITPSVVTGYSVSGTSVNGCLSSSSAVTTVSVFSLPLVSITGTNAMCAGSSASITAAGAHTYTWNTGSNATGITVAPATNTVYSVSGTNSLGCVSATTATHPFTVNALPVLSITASPQVICAGATASILANGAATYTWVGMGSLPVMGVSPSVTTSYTLTGTSSLGCEGIPVVETITVNPLPLVSISATSSICEGNTTNLTASGASSYTWTGFGSSTVLAVSPSVTTTYTLIGTSAAGCDNSAIHTLSVNPLPTLVISGSSGICTGQSATLSVSGASTYTWNTGSTGNSIVTTPTATTIYTVMGTDLLGCATTNTQLVTVASSLSISITGPTVVCEGEVFNLTASGGATYTWSTNESTQVISPNPTITTTYSVIGASGTCSNTAFASVAVNPNPTLSISGLNALCSGDSTMLTVSGADTYFWSTASNASTVMVTPTSTNIYSVVGQFTTGCFSSAATTVTVYALPALTVSGDSVLCSGSALVLNANGASTYSWSTGANTSTISVSPVNTTTYSVMGTDTNGCTNSSSIANVTVNPVPLVNVISSASAVCSGDTITLSASGADTYLWNDGAITSVVVYTPGVNATYSVTGTNSFACSSTTNIAINVNALPVIAISGPSVICLNESASLNASGASSYTWSAGDISATLLVTPATTTSYSITGTSAEGCYGTASMQVEVTDCTGLSSVQASNKVSLYPNPATAVITIELADATGAEIIIRNVLGQLIVKQKAEAITTIQLNDLNKGMYYVSIVKNNGVIYSTSLIKN